MTASFFVLITGGILLAIGLCANRNISRIVSTAAFLLALILGWRLLHSNPDVPIPAAILSCAGTSILCGLILTESVLSRGDLSASVTLRTKVARLNRVLLGAIGLRMFFAICAPLMEVRWATEQFWEREVIFVAGRWLLGLLAPTILLYMIQVRIKRQVTQNISRLLYLVAAMIFVGELIALNLTRITGLPF